LERGSEGEEERGGEDEEVVELELVILGCGFICARLRR
jgi:hypothetical protein